MAEKRERSESTSQDLPAGKKGKVVPIPGGASQLTGAGLMNKREVSILALSVDFWH